MHPVLTRESIANNVAVFRQFPAFSDFPQNISTTPQTISLVAARIQGELAEVWCNQVELGTMTPEQDDELMTYIAGGIDPVTAFVVVTPEDQAGKQPAQDKKGGCAGVLVLILAVLVLSLLG